MTFQNTLHQHNRNLCLLLASIVSLVLSLHIILAPLNPIEDGHRYAMRAFALYGYLHSGQVLPFWNLLTRPYESLCPPHVLLFFLLPQDLAGVASYVLIQNLTTNLLLAYAAFKLCSFLARPQWAPTIYLLCSVNNIALTDYCAFYLDMEFLAWGLLIIAGQIGTWRHPRPHQSFLVGVALGFLFWIKPANALIFLATFTLSEITHALIATRRSCPIPLLISQILRHVGYLTLGFLPVLVSALVCGGFQTILALINDNEIHAAAAPLACTGLIRFLYFPLCLSFAYNVLLLAGLACIAFLLNRLLPAAVRPEAPFPWPLFLPIALAYLIYGEFFSFWVLTKPMRSLLLMLPIAGIILAWLAEKGRLRSDLFFLVVLLYAGLAYSQKAFNLLGTTGPLADETYQISDASWTQMPGPWYRAYSVLRAINNTLALNPPPPGVICVNTSQLQRSLAWHFNASDLLHGKAPLYEIRTLFDFQGAYRDNALVNAHSLVLVTWPAMPMSRTWHESMDLVDYGSEKWTSPASFAQVTEFPRVDGQPIGCAFTFPHPLTETQVALFNESVPFAAMPQTDGIGLETLEGPHFSTTKAAAILKSWWQKRFGERASSP